MIIHKIGKANFSAIASVQTVERLADLQDFFLRHFAQLLELVYNVLRFTATSIWIFMQ